MADSPWPRVQALTLFRTMRRQHIEPDAVCYEVRGAHAPHAPHRTRARTHARTHARTAPHARTHARTHARICQCLTPVPGALARHAAEPYE